MGLAAAGAAIVANNWGKRCAPRGAAGQKTLRAYTVSLNLARFDRKAWQSDDATMDAIAESLDHIRKVPVLTPRMVRGLQPVDPLALRAGLLGSNPDGLFQL